MAMYYARGGKNALAAFWDECASHHVEASTKHLSRKPRPKPPVEQLEQVAAAAEQAAKSTSRLAGALERMKAGFSRLLRKPRGDR